VISKHFYSLLAETRVPIPSMSVSLFQYITLLYYIILYLLLLVVVF